MSKRLTPAEARELFDIGGVVIGPPLCKLPRVETRADVGVKLEKAESDLARWTRKLKLARTKCAKHRRRVAYLRKKLK